MKPGNKAAVSVTSERGRESTPKRQQPSSQTQIQIVLPFSTAPDKFDICQTTDCSCANLTQTLIHGCSLLHKTLNVHLRGQLSLHPTREASLPACWPLQACPIFPSLGESERSWFCWRVYKRKAEKFHRWVQNLLPASHLPWPPSASHRL